MNRFINSRQAFEESHRSFSLAKQSATHQVHDLCGKFAQMVADDLGEAVSVGMMGFRVTREPTKGVKYGT